MEQEVEDSKEELKEIVDDLGRGLARFFV